MRSWYIMMCLSLWGLLGHAEHARAQTFEQGYQAYMRNQFPVAEIEFREALKTAKTKEDRAFILKFIGICQFMRGDRKGATVSFYQAVQSDRSLSIDEEEVLDPSVVPFFQSIKSHVPPEQATAPAPQATTSAQTPTAAPPSSVPGSTAPGKVTTNKVTKKKLPKKETVEAESSSNTASGSWLYLLPFGTGQFVNAQPWLGAGVAAGQTYALYRGFSLQKTLLQRSNLNTQVEQNDAYTPEQKAEFVVANNDYMEALRRDKNLAFASFFGLWIVSGVQAYLSNHSQSPSPSSSSSGASPEARLNTYWLPGERGGSFVLGWQSKLR